MEQTKMKILILMIACGNANAQANYLTAEYDGIDAGTCSKSPIYFNYYYGGKCVTKNGTNSVKYTLNSSFAEIKEYPSWNCSSTPTITEKELKCHQKYDSPDPNEVTGRLTAEASVR